MGDDTTKSGGSEADGTTDLPAEYLNPDAEALLGAVGLGPPATHPAGGDKGWVIPGYEVLHEIARGGMGAVLAARDPKFGREVAIKVLIPDPAAGSHPDSARRRAAARQRFLVESHITAALPHPNIPPAYDLGTLPDGDPFLAMKYIRGRTFADLLAARPDPSADLPRMLLVLEQVAQAVGFAHAQGVIHRDLKPLNVMVGAFGEVLVMDWGLAKDTRRPVEESPDPAPAAGAAERVGGLTANGEVMGTLAYMPPEQAAGRTRDLDARSDVFGLGAILCEVLTGHPPFTGLSVRERWQKATACNLETANVRLNGCGADPELVALVRRCLAPNPADRPAHGQAVADALAAYRLGVEERLRRAETERATEAVRAAEERKRARVRRWLASAVALGLVVAAAGSFAGVMWHRAEGARTDLDGANRDLQTQQQLLADANQNLQTQQGLLADTNADLRKQRGLLAAANADLQNQQGLLADANADLRKQQGLLADANAGLRKQQVLLQDANSGLVEQTKLAEAATAEAKAARGRAEASDAARGTHFAYRMLHERGPTHARRLLAAVPPTRRGWEWDLVAAAARPPLAEAVVTSAAGMQYIEVSPDGRRALVTDQELVTYLFEVPSLKTVREFRHDEETSASHVTFAGAGREVRFVHDNGSVSRYDAETGKDLGRAPLAGWVPSNVHQGRTVSRDGSRVFRGGPEVIRVWDAKSGRLVATLPLPPEEQKFFPPPPKVALPPGVPPLPDPAPVPIPPQKTEVWWFRSSPRGDVLVAVLKGDDRLPVYDIGAVPRLTIPDLRAVVPADQWCGAWAVSDDGSVIAVETNSAEVVFIDPRTGKLRNPVAGSMTIRWNGVKQRTVPRQIRFTPDGRTLVVLDDEGKLTLLPVDPKPPARVEMNGPPRTTTFAGGIRSSLCAVSNRYAVVKPWEGTNAVRVFDFVTGGSITVEASLTEFGLENFANSDPADVIGLSDRGGWVLVDSLFTTGPAAQPGRPPMPGDPDLMGEVLRDGRVRLHDLKSLPRTAVRLETSALNDPDSFRFSRVASQTVCPATGQVLLGGGQGQLARYDSGTGGLIGVTRPHASAVLAVGVSRDGKVLATGDINGTVRVAESSGGARGALFENPGWPVAALALSADGRRLAAAFEAPPAGRVWYDWGRSLKPEVRVRVGAEALLPEEPRELPAGPPHGPRAFEVRVWDVATGRLVATRPCGAAAPVLSFSDDSADLYVGLQDGTLGRVDGGGVWRVLAKCESPITGVWGVAARAVFAGFQDAGPRVYDAATGTVAHMSVAHSLGVSGLSGDAATGRLVTWSVAEVKVWAIDSGHEVLDFTNPQPVLIGGAQCRLVADGSLVVLDASFESTVTRYRLAPGRATALAPVPRVARPDAAPPPRARP